MEPPVTLLAIVFFGWPALLLGAALAVVGVVVGRAWPALVGGAVLLPPALYLAAHPGGWWMLGLPVACWVDAWWIHRECRLAAAAMVAGVVAVIAWLGWFVFQQVP